MTVCNISGRKFFTTCPNVNYVTVNVTTSVTTATLVGRAHRYSRIETSKLTVIRKRFSIVNENAGVQISSRASEGCAERPPGRRVD